MNETPETTNSNLNAIKTAAAIVVMFASTYIAAKGLLDLSGEMKDVAKEARARKAAANQEI